jgi:hypothetical protein
MLIQAILGGSLGTALAAALFYLGVHDPPQD